jgi:hypothetical protein
LQLRTIFRWIKKGKMVLSHVVYSSIVNNLIRVGRGVSDPYQPAFSIA